MPRLSAPAREACVICRSSAGRKEQPPLATDKKKCDLPLRFTTCRCYPTSLLPAAQLGPFGRAFVTGKPAALRQRVPRPFGPGPKASRLWSENLAVLSPATDWCRFLHQLAF